MTIIRLASFLAFLCASKMLNGQTQDPYRLIGTKTAYNFYDTGWKSYDSTRTVYSGSAIRHQTPMPLFHFNGLEGRVPLSMNTYTPLFYAGAYPTLSYPIFGPIESAEYDSLIRYSFDYPDEDTWSVTTWNARTYMNHMLQLENRETDGSPSKESSYIGYDAVGLPVEYAISSGYFYPLDPYVVYTFTYSDYGLASYTQEYPPSGLKVQTVDYTHDASGKPTEEIVHFYQQYGSNLSYLYEKWIFLYDDKGRVNRLQRWLPYDGEWVQEFDHMFEIENDLPRSLITLYREVDTMSVFNVLGAWDTIFRTQLYYTGGIVDSVLTEKQMTGQNDLSSYRREYFNYSGDLLSAYSLLYDVPGIYNDDQNITFTYDGSGRMTSQNKTVIFDSYCSQSDSIYYYDDVGNVVLIEVHKGTSYEEPCGIISTYPEERYYYYYEEVPFAGTSEGDFALHVFPSPATDQFAIQTEALGNSSDDLLVRIFNMQGQEVFTSVRSGDTPYFTINCNSWGSGVYMVKVEHGASTAWQKVIIH